MLIGVIAIGGFFMFKDMLTLYTSVEVPHPTRDGATSIIVLDKKGRLVRELVSIPASRLQPGDHIYLTQALTGLPSRSVVEVTEVISYRNSVLIETEEQMYEAAANGIFYIRDRNPINGSLLASSHRSPRRCSHPWLPFGLLISDHDNSASARGLADALYHRGFPRGRQREEQSMPQVDGERSGRAEVFGTRSCPVIDLPGHPDC